MIATVVSYDLPPLRCETCQGSGYVDDTENYLKQFDYFWDGAGPPTAPCRICYGTGRHVSRARAGLAAPPIVYVDIETGGLNEPFGADFLARDTAAIQLAMSKIIDDVQEDTPEARERARSWFDAPLLSPAGAHIAVFHTKFRPGPYHDPLWDVSNAPEWWTKLASKPPPNFFEIENPPVFPDGIPEEVSMQMIADLHAFGEASNVFILGDPESDEEDPS